MQDAAPRPGVFISHAALPEPASTVLSDLSELARRLGFDVYLDRDFAAEVAGERYEPPLWEALHRCNAAIVLLTPDALDSAWVKAEVSRLMGRKHDDPQLLIVPLFTHGTSPTDLDRQDWRPHRLGDLQGFDLSDTQAFDALAAKLNQLADTWRARRKFGDVYLALKARLSKVHREVLVEAITKIGGVDGPTGDKAGILAWKLLENRNLGYLAASIETLGTAGARSAREILAIALPYAWLDESHASGLRSVIAAPKRQRGISTESTSLHTIHMLVRRACGTFPPSWTCLELPQFPADHPIDGLLRTARAVFSEVYQDWDMNDAQLRDLTQSRPCVLVLAPPIPDPSMLEPLRNMLPHVALCFLGASDAELQSLGFPWVARLNPPLDPRKELEVLAMRRRANAHLREVDNY